jgi:phasin family protein
MAETNDSKHGFDFTKLLGDFKVPGVDFEAFEAIMASQQKNIEALTQANKVAFEGMQAVIKLQGEVIRQAISESVEASKELTSSNSTPQDKLARQGEIAKVAFERTIANSSKMSELITKANTEAFEVLNKRFSEVMTEAKDGLSKLKK